MADQRFLILRIPPSRKINTRDVRLFSEALEKCGLEDGHPVEVVITQAGELMFRAPLPEKPQKRKSAHQEAVERQLASRRSKITSGEEVPGYEPPVKKVRVFRIPKQSGGKNSASPDRKVKARKARRRA